MKREPAGSEKLVQMTARTVIINVLLFICVLYVIAFIVQRTSAVPSMDLESAKASYTITRSDSSTEVYDHDRFPAVRKGDTLTCVIAPLGDNGSIADATLAFSLYHSYVTVYCGDTLLYAQTDPKEGQMIGHRYYLIPLPEGYENETITIVAACAENEFFNSLLGLKIVPSSHTTYAFRYGSFATAVLLNTLLMGSFFLAFSSLINYLRRGRHDGLFAVSFLFLGICLWYMGYSGFLQSFVASETFLASVEYVGLYLTAIALPFFAYRHIHSRTLVRICAAESAVLAVFFVVVTFLTLFVPGVSYVDFGWILRIIIFLTLLVLFVQEIRESKRDTDWEQRRIHLGATLTIALSLLELLRILLDRHTTADVDWLSASITPLCILTLTLTALMYYGIRITQNQYQMIEQENLKRLAYIDQLTGAPNRNACYQRLEELQKEHVTDFVVTFIDINFLKRTNDTWGHEKGDELIRTASDLLQKHFTGDDFFGRWGGDEFTAVHIGTLEETRKIMEDIQKEMDALNASGEHDFALSEAWGFGESTSENPISPQEAIRRADAQMYTAKRKAHTARD